MNSEKNNDKEKPELPYGAWLPWLPLLLAGAFFVWLGNGPAPHLAMMVYVPASFLIGLAVIFYYRKNDLAMVVAGLILIGGPIFVLKASRLETTHRRASLLEASSVFQEYCSKYASSIVYRSVTGVEGVMQLDYFEKHPIRNVSRYDAPNPWYQYSWQRTKNGLVGGFGSGYFFLEEKAGDSSGDMPVARTYLTYPAGDRERLIEMTPYEASKALKTKTLIDASVRSKYGWRAKDLTTDEMRDLWITGGNIEIIEMSTGEVLGELTGFLYAGAGYGSSGSWIPDPHFGRCEGAPAFWNFLREVLVPAKGIPSEELVQSLGG